MSSMRHYYVTFDIQPSAGRNNDYKKVRDAVELMVGTTNYFPLVMQGCIVQTTLRAVNFENAIRQRLGGNCNILVMRLARGYAFKSKDPKRRAMAAVLDKIQPIQSANIVRKT